MTFFSWRRSREQVEAALQRMENAQRHRGPDDRGTLVESHGAQGLLGLGHQRLSILDLSPAGHQPMTTPCGRYSIVYNGEVYNYRELAAELGEDPIIGVSSGDTAVVLAALVRWGTDALKRFNGMWAFVFVDRHERRMLIARDQLGIKPLYYAVDGDDLVVASEIKTVLAGWGRPMALDPSTIRQFLLSYNPAGTRTTFFAGVHEFPPGSWAEIALDRPPAAPIPERYWRHPIELGEAPRHDVGVEELRELFLDAVRLHLRSDVPVAIMLSGGIDSSAIVGAAAAGGLLDNVTTLSVVSDDPATSEEPFIDKVVAHVGCRSIKLKVDVDPAVFMADLSDTVWHLDTPFSAFSFIAHRQAMRRAADHGFKVLLTGQGADEQMAGYNKFFYFYLQDRLRRGAWMEAGAMAGGALLKGTILREFRLREAKRYLGRWGSRDRAGCLGAALAGVASPPSPPASCFRDREWIDLSHQSLPSLLLSEDRTPMAWSLEMRVPFLDSRLIDLFGRIPPGDKLRGGWTKYLLRKAIAPWLPADITWRKDKRGYSIPEDVWLRTSLRGTVEAVVRGSMRSADLGLLDAKAVRGRVDRFMAGDGSVNSKEIVSVLALEAWLERFSAWIAPPR